MKRTPVHVVHSNQPLRPPPVVPSGFGLEELSQHYARILHDIYVLESEVQTTPQLYHVLLQYRKLAVSVVSKKTALVDFLKKHAKEMIEQTLEQVVQKHLSDTKKEKEYLMGVLEQVEQEFIRVVQEKLSEFD